MIVTVQQQKVPVPAPEKPSFVFLAFRNVLLYNRSVGKKDPRMPTTSSESTACPAVKTNSQSNHPPLYTDDVKRQRTENRRKNH
jgi:hypothetical protein